jgi:hypothetical protein
VAQHGEQVGLVLGCLFRLSAGEQQLAFVASPVGRVEQRDSVEQRRAARVAPLPRIHQHREDPAVSPNELERDFVREALHLQQRGIMRLVVDP